jgi:hypothetical protein
VGCKKDDDNFVANKAPIVDAGPTKTITLPDSVVLTGSASDTDGHVVAYLWSQVSGPAQATIAYPGTITTTIKFSLQGTYIFQLMATDDKGATGADTVRVIVNPSPIKTITLSPSTEFVLTSLNGVDQSHIAGNSLDVNAWTGNGYFYPMRSIVKFDLSSIPASAVIKSANLYLYSDPTPPTGDQVNANSGTSNALLIQQITSSWSTSTATWANQPSVATSNQIVMPATTQSILDLNVDATTMVGTMVNTSTSYGFLLRLQTEVTYNSRTFVASGNTTYPDKHPKLVITYQ